MELGVEKVCLKTNNQGVAPSFQSRDQDRSRFSPLIEEIKELLAGVNEHRVIWSRRPANKATGILWAKVVLISSEKLGLMYPHFLSMTYFERNGRELKNK